MARLAIVSAGPIVLNPDGTPVIDAKTQSGMAQYIQRWPGPVALVGIGTPQVQQFDVPLPGTTDRLQVFSGPTLIAALHNYRAEVAYVFHKPSNYDIVDAGLPYVLLAEFYPAARHQQLVPTQASLLAKTRATVGWRRREKQLATMAEGARGVQCNGYPTFDYYRSRTTNPLLYFDARLSAADIMAGETIQKTPSEFFRMAFSGRIIKQKGADIALSAVQRAEELGAPVELHFFGSGDLEPELRAKATEGVTFHGSVPFEPDWKLAMIHGIDAMLLPHRQDDPSCTYLEAAGLGVPIIGTRTAAITALVEKHGIGWVSAREDVTELAEKIVWLAHHRDEVAVAVDSGRAFMQRNDFDTVMQQRVDHLVQCLL